MRLFSKKKYDLKDVPLEDLRREVLRKETDLRTRWSMATIKLYAHNGDIFSIHVPASSIIGGISPEEISSMFRDGVSSAQITFT